MERREWESMRKPYLVIGLLGVLLGSAAAAAPSRVVSLNLCTDELALMLAAPGQLASVHYLAADPHETRLASRARGLHLNNSRMESVAGLAPDLVLTGGGVNRYAADLAHRLGIKVVDVPPAQTIPELRRNVRTVAQALGREAEGERLIRWMDRELGRPPATARSAVLLSGGGYTVRTDSLAAAFARYAGLAQQHFAGERVDLEQLLGEPPAVIVLTQYRAQQTSLHQLWLGHRALRSLPKSTRLMPIDGRSWTCLGPLVASDVRRLREALAQ